MLHDLVYGPPPGAFDLLLLLFATGEPKVYGLLAVGAVAGFVIGLVPILNVLTACGLAALWISGIWGPAGSIIALWGLVWIAAGFCLFLAACEG